MLKLPNQKNYLLTGVLFLAGIFMFFRFGNKIRLLLLFISLLIFGFLYKGSPNFLSLFQDFSLYPITGIQPSIILITFFIIPIVFSLFFGRIFCGSACPIGAVQEFIGKIGHAADLKTKKYPKSLKYLKYFNILLFASATFLIGSKWFYQFDPFTTLFTFSGTSLSMLLLGIILGLSFAFGRAFCKYFCPYGAILALVAKISLFKLKISKNCRKCNTCRYVCPVGAVERGSINHMECIRCGICKEKCPVGKKTKPKDIVNSFRTTKYDSNFNMINMGKTRK